SIGFSWHLSTFASSGPPAASRANPADGYAALHGESGLLPKVWRSATNAGALPSFVVQQPSTAAAGFVFVATQSMNADHARSACTGPRHMTWLAAPPFCFAIRSRMAKWNH